jgi:hypothetical protein
MSASNQEQDKVAIWDAVCATDPKYTKKFSRGGGFSGTALNATYLVHKATQLWGPMGDQWGLEIVEERLLDGAIWKDADGHDVVHQVRVRFFYPGKNGPASIYHFGQTTFVGKNKYGPYTDEEAPKKSLTDALTKCMSMLGFGADIHLGLYDDNKYVAEVTKKFKPQDETAADIANRVAQNEHKPASGVMESLEPDSKLRAELVASLVVDAFESGDKELAYTNWNGCDLDADEKVAAWAMLDSKMRSTLKRMRAERNNEVALQP